MSAIPAWRHAGDNLTYEKVLRSGYKLLSTLGTIEAEVLLQYPYAFCRLGTVAQNVRAKC